MAQPRKYTDKIPYTDCPVAVGNFDGARLPIQAVVLHTTDGTLPGTLNLFNTPPAQRATNTATSAHYVIDLEGNLYAMLEEYNNAYAVGRYQPDSTHPFANLNTISIEHVDNGNYMDTERTEAQYTTSGYLVYNICTYYGITIAREFIRKHSEVSEHPTGCPDGLNVDRIIAIAQDFASGARVWRGIGQSTNPSMSTQSAAAETVTQVGASDPETAQALSQDQVTLLTDEKLLTDLQEKNLELKSALDIANQLLIGYKSRGYTKVEDVDSALAKKDETIQGLQAQISQTLKRNKDLADIVSGKEGEDATAIDLGTQAQKDLAVLRSDLTTIAKAHGSAPTLFSILGSLDQLFNIKAHYEKLMERLSKEKITKEEIDTVVTEGEKLATSKQINKLFGL